MFGHTNEPFSLSRDVNAVIIPAGEVLILREGTSGFITQALGGSFTVYVEGNLFHIAGADADALGKEPVAPPEVPENATDEDIETVIQDAQEKIAIVPTVADVRVELVFDPPWNQSMMSDEARLQTGLM